MSETVSNTAANSAAKGKAKAAPAINLDDIQEGAEGKKKLRKTILNLAGPSLTEMVLTNFVSMLNMIMVGRVGAEAVAAAGLTNTIVFFMLATFFALSTGTTTVVARAIGAKEYETANRAAQQTFILNVALSIVFTVASVAFARPLLVWMGAAPEVLVDGVAYAKIIFASLGLMTISTALSAVLRGAGDTKTPMRVNVFTSVLVVVIGFPLIYGYFGLPAMGVIGAAIAHISTRFLATAWLIGVLFSGKKQIKLSVKNLFIIDKDMIAKIVKIGLPAAGEQFALRTGQIIMAKVVASLGTITYAANQICFNILGLTFMPGMAFAMVASTLVGQALGSKKPELAERFGWETRKIGTMVATTIGLLFVIFAPYIMMPYTNQSEVVSEGAVALRVIGFVQIAQSTQFILAGALRGAGDTKFPLYATFVGVWGFRIVLALLFVTLFHWGILGAWLAIAVDQIVRSLIIYTRYKRGKWKTIKI